MMQVNTTSMIAAFCNRNVSQLLLELLTISALVNISSNISNDYFVHAQDDSSDVSCANGARPCVAKYLSTIGHTTATGTVQSNGKAITTGEDIYGPFEAGFGSSDNSILQGLGCTADNVANAHIVGGVDTQSAEYHVANGCGITLPRTEDNNGTTSYISLLSDCGEHTSEIHFHQLLTCLYNYNVPGSEHSTQVGKEYKAAEIDDADAKFLYGKFENFTNTLNSEDSGQLPVLDACGGHFGVTPDSAGVIVYHYHVQDEAPFTFGCYGPDIDAASGNQTLVTLDKCRSLYTECGNGNVESLTLRKTDGTIVTLNYDLYCPCFDKTGAYPCNIAAGCDIQVTEPSTVAPVTNSNTTTSAPFTNATNTSNTSANTTNTRTTTAAMPVGGGGRGGGGDGDGNGQGNGADNSADDINCDGGSTRPCVASALGDVALTTATGVDSRSGKSFAVGENIFGPFEAGFGTAQDFILEGLGCQPGSLGHVAGGIDTLTAERMVARQCGVQLPRVISDGANGFISLLDECGGHTMEYHFHERLSCLYSTEAGSTHSTQVGREAGNINTGNKLLYGKYEDFSANVLPILDACGGHFGVTPDSNSVSVYHYHVQANPPFTIGCYGPDVDDAGNEILVTLEKCRSLYGDCGDNDTMTLAITKEDGTMISTTYDPWCPCYDNSGMYTCNVAGGCTQTNDGTASSENNAVSATDNASHAISVLTTSYFYSIIISNAFMTLVLITAALP